MHLKYGQVIIHYVLTNEKLWWNIILSAFISHMLFYRRIEGVFCILPQCFSLTAFESTLIIGSYQLNGSYQITSCCAIKHTGLIFFFFFSSRLSPDFPRPEILMERIKEWISTSMVMMLIFFARQTLSTPEAIESSRLLLWYGKGKSE